MLESFKETFPNFQWEKEGAYFFSRVVQHGKRRAEEMREAAHTVREAGITPLMALVTAEREEWAAAFKDALKETELGAMLDAIRKDLGNKAKAAE